MRTREDANRSEAARLREHHLALMAPFGTDAFGRRAEAFARFFGTPRFLVAQTLVVAAWIALNAAAFRFRWDPYPFILLNLAFSLQAAYAAPLILLAQTRQADRDKARLAAEERHRAALDAETARREETIERVLERVDRATAEIHARVVPPPAG